MRPETIDESQMRLMLDHLPYFVVLADRERRYLWVNRLDPTLTPDQVLGHQVDVRDSGSGMDAATAARAFEPFFTTKPIGKGSGLGLSMVHGLTAQNGGSIELESTEGAGTTLTLRLPARGDSRAPAPVAPPRVSPVEHGSETVLVVEDDRLVRNIVRRILERGGYRVFEAEDGRVAIEIFAARSSEIDLVMLDAVMPLLGGKDAYEQIVQRRPDVKVLFSTGYAAETLPDSFLRPRGLAVLPKPYDPAALLATVREVLRG
jgi:CheY-like chemotaxis protein